MHDIVLRRLLVQQRDAELVREAVRLKLGPVPGSLSRPSRVAYALRAAASVYRSMSFEPDPTGATCVVGEDEGVLVWTSTAHGARVLTCETHHAA